MTTKRHARPVAMQYAWDVRRGEIPACRYVKLAVERHFRDLENGHERGLWFDQKAAEHALRFYNFLRHSKGEWAGQILALEPWQQFIVWVLFGWKNTDGTRRFRDGYIEIARKNGKTTMAAGIALYLLVADGEPGAEVYASATKREQAKQCWEEAKRMVQASDALSARIKDFSSNLHIVGTASKFEPLGRDSKSTDGLNIHGLIKDEFHEWKDRDLSAKLDTAQGARRQPLTVAISTAGSERTSMCYELRELVIKIMEGLADEDTVFGIIYTLDPKDESQSDAAAIYEWENEEEWIKANPNLGVSVKPEFLRRQVSTAKAMPSQVNALLRYHMNLWTQAEKRWLSPDAWAACGKYQFSEDDLLGRVCYAGLDLSSTTDLSAFALVFPPFGDYPTEADPAIVLVRLFCPEDDIRLRSKRDRVPYETWVRQGLLFPTPGAAIDYRYIRLKILEDKKKFKIQEIAYDRHNADWIRQKLSDDEDQFDMIEFGQGWKSMNSPTKELERLVLTRSIAHGGNKALGWMAANVVIRTDPAGNIKTDKEKSIEKIDGIVAMIMGIGRAIVKEQAFQSKYEKEGVVAL